MGQLSGGALLAVSVPLGLTWVAVGAVDAALIATAVALGAAGGWVLRLRWQLDQLPLEVGPVAAAAWVDGEPIVRFRVRLGHGRRIRDVRAQVWRDTGADRVALPVWTPPGVVCGPFTVVARGATRADHLELVVDGMSRGRRWEARAAFAPSEVLDGRFGGVTAERGRVVFDADWTSVTDAEGAQQPGT